MCECYSGLNRTIEFAKATDSAVVLWVMRGNPLYITALVNTYRYLSAGCTMSGLLISWLPSNFANCLGELSMGLLMFNPRTREVGLDTDRGLSLI